MQSALALHAEGEDQIKLFDDRCLTLRTEPTQDVLPLSWCKAAGRDATRLASDGRLAPNSAR
ncbi:MAG: hypothetical protein EOS41_30145 [Mesorhizobium sp.]|nr:MAG: hypothetical protein EOS41_30145 [Mesorhizobium sp.]